LSTAATAKVEGFQAVERLHDRFEAVASLKPRLEVGHGTITEPCHAQRDQAPRHVWQIAAILCQLHELGLLQRRVGEHAFAFGPDTVEDHLGTVHRLGPDPDTGVKAAESRQNHQSDKAHRHATPEPRGVFPEIAS
jgi:hypothetical protein